ncbi:MAG: hypothetical protein U0167_13635 [bacterium]
MIASPRVQDGPEGEPSRGGLLEGSLAGGSWKRHLALGVFFVFCTVAVHGVTPDRLVHDQPANLGDSSLNTWILTWSAHALARHPFSRSGLFNAPIYWPHDLTLAYSDLLLPLVPVYGLLLAITRNWTLALNLTVLACLVLAQAAMFALARRLTGRSDAALLASFSYTFSSFALAHWGHSQLQTHGLLALAFLALFRALERRTAAAGAWLGLVTATVGLAAWYYGAAWAIAATTIVIGHVVVRRLRPGLGLLRTLGVAAVVAGLLLAPFVKPYVILGSRPGFERDARASWGLKARDLVTPVRGTLLYPGLGSTDCEHCFFPGFLAYGLAAAGLVALVRRRWAASEGSPEAIDRVRRQREELWLLVTGGVVCGVFALGIEVAGRPGPFGLLHDHVPGFSAIRVSSRLAIVSLLAVSCLASAGFAQLTVRQSRRRSQVLAAVALLILFAELNGIDSWARLDTSAATLDVYRELSHRGEGAVVELPAYRVDQDPVAWTCGESTRALYATIDGHPRWNGYSGYLPPDYVGRAVVFNEWPTEEATALARSLGVRYFVLHTGMPAGFPGLTEGDAAARAHRAPAGAEVGRYGEAWLIAVR